MRPREKCREGKVPGRVVARGDVFLSRLCPQKGNFQCLSLCYPLDAELSALSAGNLTDWEIEAECLANFWRDSSEAAEAQSKPRCFSLPGPNTLMLRLTHPLSPPNT